MITELLSAALKGSGSSQSQSQSQSQRWTSPPGPPPSVGPPPSYDAYDQEQYPSQQYPSQQYPSQQYPSQQYPSQQYPSQQYPSQQQYPTQGQQAYSSSGYGGPSSQWEAYQQGYQPGGAGSAPYQPAGSQWPGSQGPSANPAGGSPYPPTSQISSTPSPSRTTPREVFPPPPTAADRVTATSQYTPTQGFDKKRDPLNPPPPSFARPPPPQQGRYPPFPPLTLYSKAETLDKGFPIALPAPSNNVYSAAGPSASPYYQLPQRQTFIHPFFQRDVLEGDWRRLIEDMYILSQLSGGQKIAANVIPLATGVGFIGGMLFTKGIQKNMAKKKDEPVGNLIDTWNTYFFHPRGLHVILAHGYDNLSGDVDGPAPDWIESGRSMRRRRGSDASSSGSDDSRRKRRGRGGGGRSSGGGGGLIGKLESRFEKIESKFGTGYPTGGTRRDQPQAPVDEKEQEARYRLVVVPI